MGVANSKRYDLANEPTKALHFQRLFSLWDNPNFYQKDWLLMNFESAERTVLQYRCNNSEIDDIRVECFRYKKMLDYFMMRFLDQFGSKLDTENNDKYHRFAKIQSKNYAKVTRLTRVIDAYVK
jgi:hypothetical protein